MTTRRPGIRLARWIQTTMVLGLVACGSGSSDGGGAGTNTMTAQVNGGSFTATETGASYETTNLHVAGQLVQGNTTDQINLYLFGITGAGTYTVATQPLNFANYLQITGSTTVSWTSSNAGATGSVTVTSLTSTHVSGTFAFTAPALTHTGATGTAAITSGSFSMDLQ